MSACDESPRRRSGDVRREPAELRSEPARLVLAGGRGRRECLLDYAQTRRLPAEPVRSPWSELRWRRPGADLDQVLVPIP